MAREPAERALEELYRVRDGLDRAAGRLHRAPAEDIVAALSNVRTASLAILKNYSMFVETLDAKTQQAHSPDPLVQTAAREIHRTCTELIELTMSATEGESTIEALRRDETEQ